ncbi:MAG TPA: sensor histidine kinase, partial [Bryobacteraceae bacterium]|nr:sensor histidine kinase [Bryobacteraceae bacterium]
QLPARVAQPMSMTLHELATNAAKYGALGAESGVIDIHWSTEGAPVRRAVRMNWRERGVRVVNDHPTRGFGTELIEQSLPYLFGGFSRLLFHPDGVECEIEFTVDDT